MFHKEYWNPIGLQTDYQRLLHASLRWVFPAADAAAERRFFLAWSFTQRQKNIAGVGRGALVDAGFFRFYSYYLWPHQHEAAKQNAKWLQRRFHSATTVLWKKTTIISSFGEQWIGVGVLCDGVMIVMRLPNSCACQLNGHVVPSTSCLHKTLLHKYKRIIHRGPKLHRLYTVNNSFKMNRFNHIWCTET